MFELVVTTSLYYAAFLLWPDSTAKELVAPISYPTQIFYKRLTIFERFPVVSALYAGRLVETFPNVMLDEMLKNSKNCDLLVRLDAESHWVFTRAVCTNRCLADAPHAATVQTEYANAVCDRRYSRDGVCCPVDKTSFFEPFVLASNDPHYLQEYEPTRNKFHSKITMTSANWVKTETTGRRGGDRAILTNPYLQLQFSEEVVCGVRRKIVDGKKVYTMFFCAKEDKCSAPHGEIEYAAERGWHEFCASALHRRAPGERETTKCCHPKYFPDRHFNQKLYNWYIPQLPFYLKYAPGLRSNYMCEVYSQYVCDGDRDTCWTPPDHAIELPDHINSVYAKQAPYLARLGVAATKVLLFHCLGTIISRRYIISAYSCREIHGIVTNLALFGDDYTSELVRNAGSDVLHLIDSIRNPYLELNPHLLPYEPTLYRTSTDIEFSHNIRPACLYHRSSNRPTQGEVPYFGKMLYDDHRGWYLRKLNMTINGNENDQLSYHSNCRESKHYSALSPYEDKSNLKTFGVSRIHEFCASVDRRIPYGGPCKYDLGTPIVTKLEHPYCVWQILGVLSSTRWDCTLNVPFVFQNISYFLRLIEDIVWPLPFVEPDIITPRCGYHSQPYWHEFWDH